MPVTVGVNSRTVVHAASNGMTIAFPDVCLTPAPPAPPVPIPYPNIAMSSDAASTAKNVKADGNPLCHQDSNFSRSSGDEAGTNGGVVSGVNMNKAEFISYSFDVKVEGKGCARALDLMLHNSKNTPPTPVIQPPLIVIVMEEPPPAPENPKDWGVDKIEVI
ncbi:DUF4150 domain-containing protein [Sorangium sp. So ce117]|uniref:DUF4150 domain-containing protein n=1 Tax=Sorangium sp. So ce117 TaxID=3133277 RepID=UPI003F5F0F89